MFLQKFVRNESIKTDPPEIYNLRTVLVSLVVSSARSADQLLHVLTIEHTSGMRRSAPFWNGHGHYWRRSHYGYLQRVRDPPLRPVFHDYFSPCSQKIWTH